MGLGSDEGAVERDRRGVSRFRRALQRGPARDLLLWSGAAWSGGIALLSLGTVFYLAKPLLGGGLTVQESVELMGAIGVLWLILMIISAPAFLLRRRSLIYAVAGTVLFSAVLYLVADNAYYLFIRRHLFADDIALVRTALQSGQFQAPSSIFRNIVGVYVLWMLLLPAFWSGRITIDTRISRALGRAIVPCAFLGTGVLGLRSATELSIPNSPHARELLFLLPWQAYLLSDHPTGVVVKNEDIRLDDSDLERTFRSIRSMEGSVENGDIRADTTPDILFLVVEGLRADMFTERYMPRLWSMREEWQILSHHYTTGSNSGTGDFGLITGLPAPFYALQRDDGGKPIPLTVLRKLGYQLSLFFTKSMSHDEVLERIFRGAIPRIVEPPEEEPAAWDHTLVSRYLEELSHPPAAPRFDFFRINVTHYNYFYPPEFGRFTPTLSPRFTIGSGRSGRLREHQVHLKNRYLNSVGYADSLIAEMITGLKSTGRWDRTAVVILGDHGEEFWEKGSFGHTFGLVREQIATTAMLHLPANLGRPILRCRYTSHHDIFPTLFDLMRISGVPRDFMRGKSIVASCDEDSVLASVGIVGSDRARAHAIIGDGMKVTIQTPGIIPIRAVTDEDDAPIREIPAEQVRQMVRSAVHHLLPESPP